MRLPSYMHVFRRRFFPGILLALSVFPLVAVAEEPAGVGNFHRVAGELYRGAQPTAAGFQSLAHLGIKTIVDLREPGKRSLWEKKLVESAGMRYVNVPLDGFSAPSPAKVGEILTLFEDPVRGAGLHPLPAGRRPHRHAGRVLPDCPRRVGEPQGAPGSPVPGDALVRVSHEELHPELSRDSACGVGVQVQRRPAR